MRQQKKSTSLTVTDGSSTWTVALCLVVLAGVLSFWPTCLDRYLAPRFFFLSFALFSAFFLLWKNWAKPVWARVLFFDLWLLGWYALNLISISWSISWSEGIFYAQKTLLLFSVYVLFRQALASNPEKTKHTLALLTLCLTGIVGILLIVQLGMAISNKGLDNETLYDYASGVFGNKSLAAEFLFMLLVFNLLFVAPNRKLALRPWAMASIYGMLFILILLLQVRTALVATLASFGLYGLFRVFDEPAFRSFFLRKILPAGVLLLGLVLGAMAWKGSSSTLFDRLNPLNYWNSDTANERRFIWYKTDQLNADHFWFGVGNGSWKFWLPSKSIEGGYRLEEKNVVFTRAHNDYLEIRAEMGIVGILWFWALFGFAFLLAFKGEKKAAIGLLGYCIIQYFDFPRERIEFQLALGLLFALIAHQAGEFGLKIPEKRQASLRRIGILVLFTGLAFNLLIGLERMRGEIHNVRLMDAQARSEWRKVLSESLAAENSFYQYTDSATPIAWHEGVAWYQLGQFEKATTAFERAYRLNPWSFQVINNYASALIKMNRYADAIPLFEKAVTINPHYDEGKFNLCYIYYQMADYRQSEAWLSRVDTIAGAANEADRAKNRAILKQVEEFKKVLYKTAK